MLRLLLPVLRIHGRHPRGLNLLAAAAHGQPTAAAVRRTALRLLSTPTAASNYLVDTWGLTSAEAREAAEHLSCRSNANAVRAYLLDGLGLSKAAAARAIAKKPQLLHSSVEDTLAPCVAELRGECPLMRPEDSEIRRLVAAYPELLLSRLYIARFKFYRSRFCLSKAQMFSILGAHPRLLDHTTNKVALNVAFLKQFLAKFRDGGGLGPIIEGLPGGFILKHLASDLDEVLVLAPRLFTATREELEAVVARAEERGGGDTFASRVALVAGHHPLCREGMSAKVELLESLGFSGRQVGGILLSLPSAFVVSRSEEKLRGTVEFFTKEVGWELDEVARCWILFQRSVDMRLRPFFKVFNILRDQGLLEEAIPRCSRFPSPFRGDETQEELDPDSTSQELNPEDTTCDRTQELNRMLQFIFQCPSERRFEEACVRPYEETIPALTDAYAAARASPCRW